MVGSPEKVVVVLYSLLYGNRRTTAISILGFFWKISGKFVAQKGACPYYGKIRILEMTENCGGHDVTTFGVKLQEFREARGLSQAGLARVSGVPVGTIRDYEQGRRDPSFETAVKLARAVKQSLDAFVAEPTPAKKTHKRRETP
jgi:DNA-binding XRE family transcriptional regulator